MSESLPQPIEALGERFLRFALRECRDVSPLYERLSTGIATEPSLLALAGRARLGQPVPNLFLAAVHLLLLKGARHPLAAFYPSVSGAALAAGDPLPAFREFCFEHEAEIVGLIASRIVQTNEVRRSACLLPAFGLVAARAPGRPLALVEIGASAGLNLLPDRYGYDYGAAGRCGDPAAPVRLACTPRGARRLPIPSAVPAIAFRRGLDLNPIDLRDPEAALWLRALVWPEHTERADLLRRALRVVREHPPTLVAGDVFDLLPSILADVPGDALVCVFHTHTVNQFSPEARERLTALLVDQAAGRDLFRISIEGFGELHPVLRLATYAGGREVERRLAHCDGHGAWLEWLEDGCEPRMPPLSEQR